MTNFRTAVLSGIVLLTAFFAVLTVQALLASGTGGEAAEAGDGVRKILETLADSANELEGEEVESDVIFDGATVKDGRLLTYAYTVQGVPNRSFDARIVRMARDQLNRMSCADKILRNAVDAGAAVRYVYLGPGQKRLLVIEVDRHSCLASK